MRSIRGTARGWMNLRRKTKCKQAQEQKRNKRGLGRLSGLEKISFEAYRLGMAIEVEIPKDGSPKVMFNLLKTGRRIMDWFANKGKYYVRGVNKGKVRSLAEAFEIALNEMDSMAP